MNGVIETFTLAFALGLTGALAPGPTFVVTVNASLAGGWKTGPKVTLGHMAVELAIALLIVFGFATVALPYMPVISLVGGCALILFGFLTLAGCRQATVNSAPEGIVTNPYLAGIVTSMANPYFWLWWLSIGSAMVIAGLSGGLLLVAIFMIGHWCADLGWYTLLSYSVSRGKTLLQDRTYRIVMACCGIFLVVFGAYYLSGAFLQR